MEKLNSVSLPQDQLATCLGFQIIFVWGRKKTGQLTFWCPRAREDLSQVEKMMLCRMVRWLTKHSFLDRVRQAQGYPVRDLRRESWVHHQPHLPSQLRSGLRVCGPTLRVSKPKHRYSTDIQGSWPAQFPCVDPDTHAVGPWRWEGTRYKKHGVLLNCTWWWWFSSSKEWMRFRKNKIHGLERWMG